DPGVVDSELQARGVRALLRGTADEGARMLLILTAAHDPSDVEFAAHVIREVLEDLGGPRRTPALQGEDEGRMTAVVMPHHEGQPTHGAVRIHGHADVAKR
ncbi:MAG: hypothetical protein ACRENJ_05005, partial [Candidatus Eiseniibacteriota bacterium]